MTRRQNRSSIAISSPQYYTVGSEKRTDISNRARKQFAGELSAKGVFSEIIDIESGNQDSVVSFRY